MNHNEHIVGEGEIEFSPELEEELNLPVVNEHTQELSVIEDELAVSPLSPLEMQIAEEKLNNVAPKAIAIRLGVSDKVVRIILGRMHVKKYIKDVFESVTAADKEQRMQLMAGLIEQKMAEEGVTSKLDLAQLIQILDSMGKVKEQADVGSQGSVMINILNTLKRD